MDVLTIILYFIVIPIAVVLFSATLQKIINSPLLVSSIVFITFIIIALVFSESSALLILSAIALGLLALVTSILTNVLSNIMDRLCNSNNFNNSNSNNARRCSRLCCRRICGRRNS